MCYKRKWLWRQALLFSLFQALQQSLGMICPKSLFCLYANIFVKRYTHLITQTLSVISEPMCTECKTSHEDLLIH